MRVLKTNFLLSSLTILSLKLINNATENFVNLNKKEIQLHQFVRAYPQKKNLRVAFACFATFALKKMAKNIVAANA